MRLLPSVLKSAATESKIPSLLYHRSVDDTTKFVKKRRKKRNDIQHKLFSM